MLSSEEVNILGNIINTTFGKSSTPVAPTMSIKTSLSGDTMLVQYTTVVYLASERNLREQLKRFEDESVKIVNQYIKNCKKDFKDMSGRALKTKMLDTNDSVELITTSPYTPRKTAYYRRYTTYSYA
jgi:hypothetical protein